jgi:hypothetical protein
MSIMNLDRRTFLAGIAPITIAGAAGAAGLPRVVLKLLELSA